MDYVYARPAHRLFDSAERWLSRARRSVPAVVAVATRCVADGLSSPSLHALATLSPDADEDTVTPAMEAALDELVIPRPGPGPGESYAAEVADGRTFVHDPADRISFEIAYQQPDWGGPELRVFVNGVEATSRGAGLGLDPVSLLVPTNRLRATPISTRVPIAKCGCGAYGCGSTDVVIERTGDAVHWEWAGILPFDTGALFPAEQYDHEVARLADDRSWERRIDSIRRGVADRLDHGALARHGLRLDWVADLERPTTGVVDGVCVSLINHPDHHDAHPQIFVRFDGLARLGADDIADRVVRELQKSPSEWTATYGGHGQGVRPLLAGPGWSAERGW